MVKTSLNSQTKYKLIVIFLLISFITVVFCLYYLKGLMTQVTSSRINVAETERDIALLDQSIKDYNQYTKEINKLKNTLPSSYYEIAFFTSRIEALAQSNNLTIKISIDPKVTDEDKSYSSITYSLVLNGSYSSVSKFLSQVTKLPYHTSVDDINMSVKDSGLVSDIKMRLFIGK